MRLEPLYRATFTTPERWSVTLDGEHGAEEQGFLLVEGRTTGRVSARLRATNWPRRRTDGTVTPDFRGVLETDDGAVVLYRWHGFGRAAGAGPRELVGSITHLSDHPGYRWLNDRLCALAGEVQPWGDGGFRVVVEVAELVWEPLSPGA
jgi:hypothetical protein